MVRSYRLVALWEVQKNADSAALAIARCVAQPTFGGDFPPSR